MRCVHGPRAVTAYSDQLQRQINVAITTFITPLSHVLLVIHIDRRCVNSRELWSAVLKYHKTNRHSALASPVSKICRCPKIDRDYLQHCSRKNPAWLTYKRSQRQYCVLPENGHRLVMTGDLDIWPFNPEINRFPGLTVEHLCVKFGDPVCSGFSIAVCRLRGLYSWRFVRKSDSQRPQSAYLRLPHPVPLILPDRRAVSGSFGLLTC